MFEKQSTPNNFSFCKRNTTPCLNLRNVFDKQSSEQRPKPSDKKHTEAICPEISLLHKSSSLNGLCGTSTDVNLVPKILSEADITQLVSRCNVSTREESVPSGNDRPLFNSTPALNVLCTEKSSIKSPVNMGTQTCNSRLNTFCNRMSKSGTETPVVPTFSFDRAEHIYDEIGDICPEYKPQPFKIRRPPKGHTPVLNRNLSVRRDCVPDENSERLNNHQSFTSTNSDSQIRHLHNSPDVFRKAISYKYIGNTPVSTKINSSLTKNKGNNKSSSKPLTPLRVHPLLQSTPQLAYQNFEREKKIRTTPRKMLSRFITKMTPKIKKTSSFLHQTDDEDNGNDDDDNIF